MQNSDDPCIEEELKGAEDVQYELKGDISGLDKEEWQMPDGVKPGYKWRIQHGIII